MGRIFLVRHGKVDIDQSEPIAGRTLASFVDRYDNAGIVTSMLLPRRVLEIGRTANLIVCSDRRRALESAALMAPDADILVKLLHLASTRGSVVLVGHGLFNRYIARCLRREGFAGPRLISTRPWGVAEYAGEPPPIPPLQ